MKKSERDNMLGGRAMLQKRSREKEGMLRKGPVGSTRCRRGLKRNGGGNCLAPSRERAETEYAGEEQGPTGLDGPQATLLLQLVVLVEELDVRDEVRVPEAIDVDDRATLLFRAGDPVRPLAPSIRAQGWWAALKVHLDKIGRSGVIRSLDAEQKTAFFVVV